MNDGYIRVYKFGRASHKREVRTSKKRDVIFIGLMFNTTWVLAADSGNNLILYLLSGSYLLQLATKGNLGDTIRDIMVIGSPRSVWISYASRSGFKTMPVNSSFGSPEQNDSFTPQDFLNPTFSRDSLIYATDRKDNRVLRVEISDISIVSSQKFSVAQSSNFITEMEGLNLILVGLSNGNLNIFESDLGSAPSVIDLGDELGYFGSRGGAFKKGSVYVSLSTNNIKNKVTILRLDSLCHSSCKGKCHEMPVAGVDLKCTECPAYYTKNSINGCEIQCAAGSNPNTDYTRCIQCDTSCCASCSYPSFATYPYIPKSTDLQCNGEVTEGYSYTDGTCNKILGYFGPKFTLSEGKN